MLLSIERIRNLNFARIEHPIRILKNSLTNLNLSPNSITIAQFNLLQLNLGLQDITIPNFTVGNIGLNPEDIVRADPDDVGFDPAVAFYQDYCFLFDYVVISEDYLFCFVLADYRA